MVRAVKMLSILCLADDGPDTAAPRVQCSWWMHGSSVDRVRDVIKHFGDTSSITRRGFVPTIQLLVRGYSVEGGISP